MSKNFDRLVKLLKLGHGTSNEAEAMAAIDKAHEYAATYGLDLAAAKRAMAGESLAGEATMAKADGQYSAPKGQLDLADRFVVVSLAEFCGVKVWRAVDEDGIPSSISSGMKWTWRLPAICGELSAAPWLSSGKCTANSVCVKAKT